MQESTQEQIKRMKFIPRFLECKSRGSIKQPTLQVLQLASKPKMEDKFSHSLPLLVGKAQEMTWEKVWSRCNEAQIWYIKWATKEGNMVNKPTSLISLF